MRSSLPEQQLQRTLYAAHMNLAQHAWEAGDIRRVRELLERAPSQAGESDLRGFEWYYLYRLCHAELLTLKGTAAASAAWPSARTANAWPAPSAGDMDTEVKVWDAQTGQELLALKGAWRASWPSARTANAWPAGGGQTRRRR